MSPAAKRALRGKATLADRSSTWLRVGADFARNWASAVSAIALVLIGYATLQINKSVLTQTQTEEAVKRALVSEIEALRDERRSLASNMESERQTLRTVSATLSQLEEDLESSRNQSNELRSKIQEQIREKQVLSAELNEIERQRIERRKAEVRSSFSAVLSTFKYGPEQFGKGISAYDLVDFEGAPIEVAPLTDFYPATKQELWAELATRSREWLLNQESEDEEYARSLVDAFLANCYPQAAPSAFDFPNGYPNLEHFESAANIWPTNGTRLPKSEYEAIRDRAVESRRRADAQIELAADFAKKFNSARGEYIVSILDSIYLCPDSTYAERWVSERDGEFAASFFELGSRLNNLVFSDPNNLGRPNRAE